MNIIKQLQFATHEIRNKKIHYFKSTIQFIIALLVMCLCINSLLGFWSFTSKFNQIFKDSEHIYYTIDNTDEEKIGSMIKDTTAERKLFSFYKFLSSSEEFDSFFYYTDFFPITNDDNDLIAMEASDGFKYYMATYVDENFLNTFKLKAIKGRIFNKDDYTNKADLTPIILGYYYDKFYKPGDIIDDQYEVVGILEKNSFYIDPHKTKDVLYLDKEILSPLIVDSNTDVVTLDMIINNVAIKTDNIDILNGIVQKSESMNLYDYEYKSYASQFEYIIDDYMTEILFYSSISFLILLFCIICIVCSLINYIETHKREFAIHIFCGASKKDFIARIVLQIAMSLLPACIITFIVNKISPASVITFGFTILLIVIISLVPSIKINKLTTSELLKRSE